MSVATTVESHAVEVNGTKLVYRECGKGDPLVLVHGHISDQRAWIDLEPKFATRFHVYNYSRRFAWPNAPIKDDVRSPWEQDALDLAAFIETLDIEPVHLLANSSGATVSLYLARTKPHLFRTLMVEEPPLVSLFLPSLPPPLTSLLSFLIWHPITFWPLMYQGATVTGPTIQLCKKGEYDQAFEVFLQGVLNPKFWPRIQANLDHMQQVEDNSKWLCQFFRYSNMPKYTAQDAQNLKVPTLVMAGRESKASQRYTAAELFRVCGAAKKRLAYIEAAGHLMHEDNPQQVFEEVGATPMQVACRNGWETWAKMLLDRGIDVNAAAGWYGSGLSAAAGAPMEDRSELVMTLLKAGANVNGSTDDGSSTLYKAAVEGRTETIKVLIEARADTNGGGKIATPLEIACKYSSPQIVEILLAAKADANAPALAKQWGHALYLAAHAKREMVHALL